ncbi:IS3 family transposase [Geobacter pickeringii]|uniref:IS3 family transposase n=1 Tax=Geobacter pickeringii TaxID=345632 RepID=UPI0038B3C0CE
MKAKRFTEEQIIGILKQAEAGMKVVDLCRMHGVSDATFYTWRKKYGGMDVSDAKRLKQLEDENRKLKQMLAEALLDNKILKDVVSKKVVAPAARRHVVEYLRQSYSISERRACKLSCLDRSSFRYQPKPDKNTELRIRLRELAEQRRKFGSPRLHVLLQREGHQVNHKRIERLYREEGLSLRGKKRKKRLSHLRVVLDWPQQANEHWSMDFVSDSLWNGRRFRVLTIVDDLTKECPALEVDHSLPGLRVTRVLDRLASTRGLPKVITVDNGPEFISRAMDAWAYEKKVRLRFIQPGKPVQNAYIESFNGKLREECLNENVFIDLYDARKKIEAWRKDYNTFRPHSSLNNLTPEEFANSLPQQGQITNFQMAE